MQAACEQSDPSQAKFFYQAGNELRVISYCFVWYILRSEQIFLL